MMSSDQRGGRRLVATASAAGLAPGLLLACTAEPEPAPFQPTLVWGACADDVETTFLTPHECGTLTVLVDRAEPDGGPALTRRPRCAITARNTWSRDHAEPAGHVCDGAPQVQFR